MKKHPNSVFGFPYCKKYYLTHPWKLFKQLGHNLKAAWMRCTKGWCPWDVWDWDCWFMTVVPEQFRYLAEHGCAYPGKEPFDTPEKWHDWLNHLADMIETGAEGWQDEHNEYYEKYIDELMAKPLFSEEKDEKGNIHHIMNTQTTLDDNYFNRAKELAEQGDQNIRYVLGQIAEHFYEIWD
jgi:hypothetical protein